ncbi:hypothetical protein C8Q70DRAFT_552460 [Cubamyces menziesii]|nr:hypothetical protein C8Q70DRAFT_552460 [Cubamyces menziesii]
MSAPRAFHACLRSCKLLTEGSGVNELPWLDEQMQDELNPRCMYASTSPSPSLGSVAPSSNVPPEAEFSPSQQRTAKVRLSRPALSSATILTGSSSFVALRGSWANGPPASRLFCNRVRQPVLTREQERVLYHRRLPAEVQVQQNLNSAV